MPTAKLQLSYKDHDREIGSVGFRGVVLTAANFDAQNTLMDAVKAAVAGLTLGVLEVETRQATRTDNNAVPPADPFAQRETKFLVKGRDASGNAVTYELPCADLAELTLNENTVDLTAGAGLALKTAVEAYAISKAEAAVTVDEVIHVGRNI